jgi:hypothetical protein
LTLRQRQTIVFGFFDPMGILAGSGSGSLYRVFSLKFAARFLVARYASGDWRQLTRKPGPGHPSDRPAFINQIGSVYRPSLFDEDLTISGQRQSIPNRANRPAAC